MDLKLSKSFSLLSIEKISQNSVAADAYSFFWIVSKTYLVWVLIFKFYTIFWLILSNGDTRFQKY